jgi:hypothetical protein
MQRQFHVSRPNMRIAPEREVFVGEKVFVGVVDCPAACMPTSTSSPKRRNLKHTCGSCSRAHAVGGNATTGSACSCGRKVLEVAEAARDRDTIAGTRSRETAHAFSYHVAFVKASLSVRDMLTVVDATQVVSCQVLVLDELPTREPSCNCMPAQGHHGKSFAFLHNHVRLCGKWKKVCRALMLQILQMVG